MSGRVFGRPLPFSLHSTQSQERQSARSTTMVNQLSWDVNAKNEDYLRLLFVDDKRLRCAMQDFLNGKFLPQGKINKKTHTIVSLLAPL